MTSMAERPALIGDLPLRRLYKFWSLRSEYGREAITAALRHNRLWWASPSTFNDPYDCRPRMTYSAGPLKRAAIARRIMNERKAHLSPAERRASIRAAAGQDPIEFAQNLETAAGEWIDQSAVCCFTRDPSNLLMWGHYADSHRGVGLMFSELGGADPWTAWDVTYTDERPVVDFVEELRGSRFVEAILRKASSWSYEKESRMIEYREPQGYRSFPRACLLGVLLGSKISTEDEAWVRSEVQNYRPHLAISRAQLSSTEYRVELYPA